MQSKTVWIIGSVLIVIILALVAYSSYMKGRTETTAPMQTMPANQMPMKDMHPHTEGMPMHEHDSQMHAAYYCPMHPDQTSDRPGKCPVCGMEMEKRM